jgi:hypothetical protein
LKNLTPFIPLSFTKGEGKWDLEEGAKPPLKRPISRRGMKEV